MKSRLILIRQKYTPFGGAERFLERALSGLSAEGVKLSVIARDWQPQDGVELIPCRPFHIGRTWRDSAFARCACRHVAAHPDALVQAHERLSCCDIFRAGDGTHRGWLYQRARARGWRDRWLQSFSPYHQHILRAERSMFLSPRLKAVICNSRLIRDEIHRFYGVDETKLHVIYNGVDTQRFHPRLRALRETTRRAFGIPSQSLLYLFVGSGFERKGVDALLEAFARQPDDAHLLVVGKERHIDHYRRKTQRLSLASRVIFTGPRTDVERLYGAADVFVLPTLYDPFPNAALEAMASGLPLVTSYQCGASDFIRDGENGSVCDALDIVALADRLHALRDPELRTQFGESMRELANTLDIGSMSRRLLELYGSLLK